MSIVAERTVQNLLARLEILIFLHLTFIEQNDINIPHYIFAIFVAECQSAQIFEYT